MMRGKSFMDARILIVDDEPANVELLRRLLERAGFSHRQHERPARGGRLYLDASPDSSCSTCTCRTWTAWR